MSYFFIVSVFVLGTIIGSFLNVVILRYGKKTLRGRSFCPSCKKILTPCDLIPLFSFLFLRGRCRYCRVPISFQYFIVEVLSGLLFVLIFLRFSFPEDIVYIVLSLVIWSVLLVITVYDFYHKIIPDGLVSLFILFSFLTIFLRVPILHFLTFPYVLDVFAGLILFLPFFLLWLVSNGRWIGLGDGKLAIGIGFLLGLKQGVSAIIFGFWIGAVVSLTLIVVERLLEKRALLFSSKTLTMKSEIPFAPFLILGTAIAFFLRLSLFSFTL
ncbi:MAG: prepilin peptidase [Candidatus Pacebacteria bacterium]|nr:prepilin peptidase [Candidatus Paceibacterota bacterium]